MVGSYYESFRPLFGDLSYIHTYEFSKNMEKNSSVPSSGTYLTFQVYSTQSKPFKRFRPLFGDLSYIPESRGQVYSTQSFRPLFGDLSYILWNSNCPAWSRKRFRPLFGDLSYILEECREQYKDGMSFRPLFGDLSYILNKG